MKIRWKQLFYLQLVLTALVFIGCDVNSSAVESSTYVTYKDDKNRFTIDYPNDWTVDKNRKDVTVMFLSPKENEKDNYKKSISVLVTPLPYEESGPIEKYMDKIVSGMKQSFPESEVVSSRSKTINNYPAIEVVLEGKTVDYTVRANYIINGKTGYVITFGYPTNTSNYSTVLDKVLHSFTITNSDAKPTAYVTYKDDKNHFTIDYPNNWSIDNTEKKYAVMFDSPKENEQDTFIEHLNVTVGSLPYEATSPISTYKEGIVATLKKGLPKMEIKSTRELTINNYPALEIVLSGEKSGVKYMVRQNYFVKGKTTYVVSYSFSDPISGKENYSPIFEKMLHSFTITK